MTGKEDDLGIDLTVQTGHIKEFIEVEGLVLLLSLDHRVVLAHLDCFWVEGGKCKNRRTRERLPEGSLVSFMLKTFSGEAYKDISEDKVLHQAVTVWTEPRPNHLLKMVGGEEFRMKLLKDWNSFILYLKGDAFLRAALVRVKGKMASSPIRWASLSTNIPKMVGSTYYSIVMMSRFIRRYVRMESRSQQWMPITVSGV